MKLLDRVSLAPQIFRTLIKNAGHAQRFGKFQVWIQQYCFTVIFVALCVAKVVHLCAHRHSLLPSKFLLWGATFFIQDALVILFARILTQPYRRKWVQVATTLLAIALSLPISGMASANTSFFVATGAEIHWRRVHNFHRDEAAIRTLLTGLAGFLFVECFILTISWFVNSYLYNATGHILDILTSALRRVYLCIRRKPVRNSESYAQIPFEDYDDDVGEEEDSLFLLDGTNERQRKEKPGTRAIKLLKRLLVLLPILVIVALRVARPPDAAYAFLSCTLPLSPFIAFGNPHAGPVNLTGLEGDYTYLSYHTALAEPPFFDFLPHQKMKGFEDWSPDGDRDRLHYNAFQDPLHISNLDRDVLEPLREALHNGSVNIKHVILIKLESTRGDVFPVRNGTFMYDHIADSYSSGEVPKQIRSNLVNLTRTARFLTGTATGLDTEEDKKPSYGGLSATNAHTAGTYTLKSVVGTLCGVTPVVADFNREYKYHIYQPCAPHILDVLNRQPDITNKTDDFTTWPWRSMWMQSVTDGYDNQNLLTPALGFKNTSTITKEKLEDPSAKYYPPKSKEINYYGYADTELREYVRDAIKDAEHDHKRLFLTHLTGTTHHPWAIPGDKYVDLLGYSKWFGVNRQVNQYLNSIGFVDKWLAEILQILKDTGVANETLLVMTGDHGLSLPNDGSITPYDNPNIGSFNIPIVFSHPHLPQVEIDSPVISSQILPTMLDLLVESSSLGKEATRAVKQLLPMYEGQSMIRPLVRETEEKQDWQFTVMNTGGTWLALRSAAKPYRLVIPLIGDVEWRFTDLERDPNESDVIMEFDLRSVAKAIEKRYDDNHEAVVQWLNDAAHVAGWWVQENWKRYGYDPNEPAEEKD